DAAAWPVPLLEATRQAGDALGRHDVAGRVELELENQVAVVLLDAEDLDRPALLALEGLASRLEDGVGGDVHLGLGEHLRGDVSFELLERLRRLLALRQSNRNVLRRAAAVGVGGAAHVRPAGAGAAADDDDAAAAGEQLLVDPSRAGMHVAHLREQALVLVVEGPIDAEVYQSLPAEFRLRADL